METDLFLVEYLNKQEVHNYLVKNMFDYEFTYQIYLYYKPSNGIDEVSLYHYII